MSNCGRVWIKSKRTSSKFIQWSIDTYAISTAQSTRKTVQQVTEFFFPLGLSPIKSFKIFIDYDYLKFSLDFKEPKRMRKLMRSIGLCRKFFGSFSRGQQLMASKSYFAAKEIISRKVHLQISIR